MNPKEVLIGRLIAGKRKEESAKIGEFIRDQWLVEIELVSLILDRGTRKGCIDETWFGKLASVSLGQKISFFQLCADKKDEESLIDDLKNYNKIRNQIVHIMARKKINSSLDELLDKGLRYSNLILSRFEKIHPMVAS